MDWLQQYEAKNVLEKIEWAIVSNSRSRSAFNEGNAVYLVCFSESGVLRDKCNFKLAAMDEKNLELSNWKDDVFYQYNARPHVFFANQVWIGAA